MSRYSLDVRRLLCPLPVIRAQDRVGSLHRGDLLDVRCTDPGALHDIPAWCRINGHRVVATREEPDELVITIEVAGHD